MSTVLRLPLALAPLLLAASSSPAAVHLIRADGTGDYPTIQAAVDAALPGDEILLARGTYRGTGNGNVNLKGKAISISSVVSSSPECVAATIIDCGGTPGNHLSDQCRRAFILTSGETSDTRIRGLTIINGQTVNRMHYGDPGLDDGNGGAIWCKGSTATISNCVFRDCNATYGSAIYHTGSQLRVYDCTFVNCLAYAEWGWMDGASVNCADSILQDCTFSGSDLAVAGTATISRCSVTGATGIACSGNVTMTQCTVAGNYSSSMNARPAGVSATGGTVSISNCVIDANGTSNWAYPYNYDMGGAGLSCYDTTLTVTNSRITRNNCVGTDGATGAGAGLYALGSTVTLTGCTLAGNAADLGGAIFAGPCYTTPAAVTLRNCIVWGNGTGPIYVSDNSTLAATYSDIQGGLAGTGNIDADPRLATGFRLAETSPCIDAGDPAYVAAAGETDLDGNPRILYGVVDMGSDEFVAPCDFNADGQIDVADLLIFVDAWGSAPGDANYDPACDLNHDDATDVVDLLIFVDSFNARIPPMP